MALPRVVRILGAPTKLFYDAFRHSQRAVADEPRRPGEVVDPEDEVNPFVGFRISMFMGATAVFAVFQTLDRRAPIFVILAFTGLSCAWQLRPFWRRQPRMDGKMPRPGIGNWILSHHAATSLVLDVVGNGAMAVSLAAARFFGAWNGRGGIGWPTRPLLPLRTARGVQRLGRCCSTPRHTIRSPDCRAGRGRCRPRSAAGNVSWSWWPAI